ncbi:NepR family anti-sigma factor [Roseivivax sp. CAU 1753]
MVHNDSKRQRDDVIDDNLKKVYQDMLDQEVPDRFLDLLSQLKAQDNGSSDTPSEQKE